MDNRTIFLSIVSLFLIGIAQGQMIKIPASQDVYVDMQANEIFNSQVLKCDTTSGSPITNMGNKVNKEFPGGPSPQFNLINKNIRDDIALNAGAGSNNEFRGWPMIQFNISNLNIGDTDIAILVIKASDIQYLGQPGQVALLPLESNWNEKSSFVDVFFNLKPFLELAENFDTSKMSLDTEDDMIFAFDVSKKLREARTKGQNNISFTLMAVTSNSYNIDFMSRETNEGPYLLLMQYPSSSASVVGAEMQSNLSVNEIVMPANIIVSPTENNPMTPPINEVVAYNKTARTNESK